MRSRIKPYSFHRRQGNKRDIQTNQLPFDTSNYNSLACVYVRAHVCVCVLMCVHSSGKCMWSGGFLRSQASRRPAEPPGAIVRCRSCMTDATKEETLIL